MSGRRDECVAVAVIRAGIAVAVALALPVALGPVAVAAPARRTAPMAVVALIDTGINPYSAVFRDPSPLARKHPSTYLPGYPRNAKALPISLGLPYDQAIRKDARLWAAVGPGTLYWIPGTRIVGAISLGSGGTNCPPVAVPPANLAPGACADRRILDDHGHGTAIASRAAGGPTSLAPGARIVMIEGMGPDSVRWAADAGWIDVQSNSWIDLIPQPASLSTAAFSYAVSRTLTVAASGNGATYFNGVAPTPTYGLSTAPAGVVIVGGHDNGRVTAWSGAPAHVVTDAYAGLTGLANDSSAVRADPIACCTSAAAPYAAGGAAALVLEARRILGHRGTGARDGVLARGRPRLVATGPLADGVFTLDELRTVLFRTAEARPRPSKHDGLLHWAGAPRPPDFTHFGPGANPYCQGCTTMPVEWATVAAQADPVAFQSIGYGAVNERSVALGIRVLGGRAPMPARAAEDAAYERDQAIRRALAIA